MIWSSKALRASLAVGAAVMAFPATGLAATQDSSDAVTTIGSELSIVAQPTTLMGSVTHAVPASGSTPVEVTSTAADWSLTATDEAATGKGRMHSGGSYLTQPVQVVSGSSSGDLTDAGVSVAGHLNETRSFDFTQALAPAEDVLAGDVYEITVTYTAADTSGA
jgi:hypothetical protein